MPRLKGSLGANIKLNGFYDVYGELDYGGKNIDFNGLLNGDFIDENKARDAMRISFGIMFYM